MNPEALETISSQLITWLQSVEQADVLEYARRLPEDQIETFLQLKEQLILDLVVKRNRELDAYFGGNYLIVLSEPQLLKLINACSQYNASSVVENFSKKIPALKLELKATGQQFWADQFIKLWENAFFLLAAPKYLQYSVYLKSLIKLNLSHEEILSSATSIKGLHQQVLDSFEDHNFEMHILEADIQTLLREFLQRLTIFPSGYIQDTVSGKASPSLLQLLETLTYCFSILEMAIEAEVYTIDETKLLELLWDELHNDEQLAYFAKEQVQKLEAAKALDIDQERESIFIALSQVMTLENIESGYCQEYLHTYISQLTPEQKKSFVEIFTSYCHLAPEVSLLFDPLDIDYFIKHLQADSLSTSRLDFINSLQEKIVPDIWPLTQKAMLLMATIF